MTIVRAMAPLAALAMLAGLGQAFAQSTAVEPGVPPEAGGAGLRSGNIATTGQTVPNPRTLPAAPRSAVDRDLPGNDSGRTDYGICKGC